MSVKKLTGKDPLTADNSTQQQQTMDMEEIVQNNSAALDNTPQQDATEKPVLQVVENKQVSAQKARLNECIQAVDEILQGYPIADLPATMQEILTQPWRKLLVVIMLREGTDSAYWHNSIAVVEQITKSFLTNSTPAARYQLISNMPKLRIKLQEGFAYISLSAKSSNRLLNALQTCCIKSMARK